MADSEENERQIAARRLAHVLEEHGIAQPQKRTVVYVWIGMLIGCLIGVLIGWLIWA
jgi:ABC-type nitrate/sulfonate/bicarbonate transport system permease component